mmetsp:Transcript_15069/g.42526  ORF Transcript_15069/g.42526 Transcript_15069/m.42526 type:complete len:123 (-) Transcript_15069:244-612(-)
MQARASGSNAQNRLVISGCICSDDATHDLKNSNGSSSESDTSCVARLAANIITAYVTTTNCRLFDGTDPGNITRWQPHTYDRIFMAEIDIWFRNLTSLSFSDRPRANSRSIGLHISDRFIGT